MSHDFSAGHDVLLTDEALKQLRQEMLDEASVSKTLEYLKQKKLKTEYLKIKHKTALTILSTIVLIVLFCDIVGALFVLYNFIFLKIIPSFIEFFIVVSAILLIFWLWK